LRSIITIRRESTEETNRTRRRFVLTEAIATLQRTPVVIDALLRGLPDNWITADESVGAWINRKAARGPARRVRDGTDT